MQRSRPVEAEPFEGFTLFDELDLIDPEWEETQGEVGRRPPMRSLGGRSSARSSTATPQHRFAGRQPSRSAQRGGRSGSPSSRSMARGGRAAASRQRQQSRARTDQPPPPDRRRKPPRRRPPRPPWPYPILGGGLYVTQPQIIESAGGSEQVRWAQNRLNQVLGMRLPVNGVLGPETREAIRTFQQQKGLPVDGILGPPTERALTEATSGQGGQASPAADAQASPPPDAQAAPAASDGAPAPEPSAPPEGELDSATSSTLATLFGVPLTVLKTLSRGLEPLAIRMAVLWGQRDENKLASLVFFARHPERGGRKLERGEPNFDRLSKEWLDIRDRLVRPVLASATGPQPGGTSAGGSLSTSFRPISVESPGGGRIKDKTPPQPADLETVSGYGGKRISLHRLAASAWRALVSAARADGIADPLLLPVSGYRSPETQETLWQNALKKYGSPDKARTWVAPPGNSAHQTGRAIDFYLGGKNASSQVAYLRTLPAFTWLAAQAERFGFYPYTAEPWHWEYNPPASGQLELAEALDELPGSWYEYEDEGYDGMFGQMSEALDMEHLTEIEQEVDRTSSAYIQWVQRSLNRMLGTKLAEDGISGTQTRSAIRSFQQRHGLTADGIVGPQTEAALIAAGAGAPPTGGTSSGLPSWLPSIPTPGGTPSRGGVSIQFASTANPADLTPYSRRVLEDILRSAGLKSAMISSTSRDPSNQARVMYNNLEQYGVEHQKRLYGAAGDQVIDVYARSKAVNKSADQIKADMERKIREIGPTNVSRHASDPQVLNVFDIAPSSIANKPAFERAVRADRRVTKFLVPPDDPGYHLEIPQ
ncbi:MAG TPA: peptidoglycan-binding protein [Herpetosiphonaceae bacterium]